MKVYLNNIHGIDDAITSLYMSKGNYTRDREIDIADAVNNNTDINGFVKTHMTEEFRTMYNKMLAIGQMHTTIIRYIDFSFTVVGLHRGGQDDLDAHAHRFNNRIVRTSTRLCKKLNTRDKSEYYENKILTLGEVLDIMDIDMPDEVISGGVKYIKADNGYINSEYIEDCPKEEQDVRRGLYNLAIPSNCIVKCDLFEYAHVYKMRNKDTHAHPELRDLIESLTDQIGYALGFEPEDIREYLNAIMN